MAQVSTPRPGNDEHLQRRIIREHSHLLAGSERDRAQVAVRKVILGDRLDACLNESFLRVLERHPVDAAGIGESPHVVVKPEDRRPGRRGITTHALEHARSVVDDVTHHMDGRILPVQELSVAPDPVMIVSPGHHRSCSVVEC